MRAMAHNRANKPVYINVKQSFNDPNRMFISSPNMVELDPEQVDELISTLQVVASHIWPHRPD